MLAVFYQTLDAKQPKWQLESSLIGSNPGLGFRPMPPESNVESTLVWYKSNDQSNVAYWVDELNNFLKIYEDTKANHGSNFVSCEQGVSPEEGKVCEMEKVTQICMPENNFNYNSTDGGPCIFLKLNKIFGWKPQYYTAANLPEKMPEDLKDHIRKEDGTKAANTVWVSCEGESPADIENIGPRSYYPTRGFPGQFFPFQNDEGYVSPYVAVHFEKPRRK
ncbi:sodium/potassium-dependent atpase beta subunit [Holotrichia oblita]|uniref:Sodium/potassium-dependent atpase beta subunit n=1 Tax=Holotrichia oblita TaxID=644536 RepID=A0ACB9TFW2_HOLOL|nr:sodium/potassium-dependent atpase beta subunit [Holotrichia oblita]